jgi:hypothetical protein
MGWGKLKKFIKPGTMIAKVFLPGAAGTVLDIVTESIADPADANNEAALKVLAEAVDAQSEISSIHESRLNALEAKLK